MIRLTPLALLRRRLPLAIGLGLVALPVFAQSTSQGVQSQATPRIPSSEQASPLPEPQKLPAPPTVTAPEAGFMLRGVTFHGASVFSEAELQRMVATRVGKNATLADLDAIAQQITKLYRERGYIFATAVVPVQEVNKGIVEISVVEGRLGRVTLEIDPAAPVSEERVRAMLAPLQKGQPLNGRVYERSMLLLSDLPGIKAQSSLASGVEAGTTDLTVKIARAAPLNMSLGLDNYGTREAGTLRAGASLRWNSPFGIGDNLDARALVSEQGGTAFGRLSYEAPLGYRGLRAGLGVSQVNYSLGGAFGALDAIGTSRIYDASMTLPLVRQRNQNFFLRFLVDRKQLTDKLRAVGYVSHKRVEGIGAGWAWERRDDFAGGGYMSSSGTLYHGTLKLLDPANRLYDASPFGGHTSGTFNKLALQLSRLQYAGPKQTLFFGIGGQLSSRNLDASEQLSLSGHDAVRAYAQGEVLANRGFIANIEYRYAVSSEISTYAFYDASRGWLNKPFNVAHGQPAIRSLRGPGLGLNWAKPGNFSVDLSLAWRTTARAVSSGGDKKPRVFLQIQKFF